MARIPCPYLLLLLLLLVNKAAARDLQQQGSLSETFKHNTLELGKGKLPTRPLGTRRYHIKPVAETFPTVRTDHAAEAGALSADIMHRWYTIFPTFLSSSAWWLWSDTIFV
jgi:hypothetical protein